MYCLSRCAFIISCLFLPLITGYSTIYCYCIPYSKGYSTRYFTLDLTRVSTRCLLLFRCFLFFRRCTQLAYGWCSLGRGTSLAVVRQLTLELISNKTILLHLSHSLLILLLTYLQHLSLTLYSLLKTLIERLVEELAHSPLLVTLN